MAQVVGIGGVFFKSGAGDTLREWYRRVLGFDITPWGGAYFPASMTAAVAGAGSVWSPFPAETDYFAPSNRDFMINFVVDDLDAVLARCKEHGVEPLTLFPDEGLGRFAHIMDPDGMKVELWEPSRSA